MTRFPSQRAKQATRPMAQKKVKATIKRALDQRLQLNYWGVFSATLLDADETPIAIALSDVPQEAAAATDIVRTADELRVREISIKMLFAFDTGGINPQPGRVIIVQWFKDATTPVIGDILLNSAAGAGFNSPYNQDKKRSKLFKIVLDRRVYSSGGSAAGVLLSYSSKKNFRKTMTFNAGGVTGSSKFYMFVLGDTATVTDQLQYKYDFIMHYEP